MNTEAQTVTETVTADPATSTTAATTETPTSLLDTAFAISDKRRKTMSAKIQENFDNRAAFEATHNPANTSIQKKLTAVAQRLVTPGIAALSIATKMDPNFMNSSGTSDKKRFNIYAIDKVADLLHGLNSGHIKNAINRCIVESLFKFQAAGVPFTNEAAHGAASKNYKVRKEIAGLLVRHTVSPATAPTQMSSTMNALATIGAVQNTGTAKHPVWILTDTPVTARLKEMVKA